MNRTIYVTLLLGVIINSHSNAKPSKADQEQRFLTDVRQLTFDGLRSGEGYFSADGSKLIFQSERHQGNPFYKSTLWTLRPEIPISYHLDWVELPARGFIPKVKKSYFPPHEDPKATQKQKEEFDFARDFHRSSILLELR